MSLTISAELELNGLSPSATGVSVKAFMPAYNDSDASLLEHTLAWNVTDKVFKSSSIKPNPSILYKNAVIVVFASHPDSSNLTSYKAI